MSTALITGASAGIGTALARVFAEHGHDLVLVARREPLLRELADSLHGEFGVTCTVQATDLAAEGSCRELFDRVNADGIEVEILVNNAGVLKGGAFRRSDPLDNEAMIALNIAALTRLSRLFVEPMVARGSGRIMNVASLGAFQPVPSLAVYSATKAYVLSFTEALGVELTGKGVTTTVLCPGFTDTDMVRDEQGRTPVAKSLIMPTEPVARAGYKACMRGDAIVVPGWANRIASSASQVAPRWLVRAVSGRAARGGRR
ncbi:MAG: SDR family oxidoreductase [Gammaproteobacteria bacterium]|nr:SDR family oxidoreductase [Gammaproteobacteria bacterium]